MVTWCETRTGGWCRRSQPRVAIWFCIAVAECGLALSSNNRSGKPRPPFPNHFFQFRTWCHNTVVIAPLQGGAPHTLRNTGVDTLTPWFQPPKRPLKSKRFFRMQSPEFFLERVLKHIKRDEAHFWLNGYVNKQNCRIWSEANPQVYVETPLHPEKLIVWCALWAGGIIGPYFFKNDQGHNVTVNGDRYRAMITNFFIPELNNHDVQELWFQQDGAICHTARATIDQLKDTFGDRLISRFGPVNWPPRSCDLTPLDYFLCVYVKSLVYADKPQTLDHLEDNIRRVIADIRPQMLEKVIENWTSRLDYIRAIRGSHMPEIIFKMCFQSKSTFQGGNFLSQLHSIETDNMDSMGATPMPVGNHAYRRLQCCLGLLLLIFDLSYTSSHLLENDSHHPLLHKARVSSRRTRSDTGWHALRKYPKPSNSMPRRTAAIIVSHGVTIRC
ncbi:transposable element Tc3 transposase [Trichonephila clavipes]|nr:transposable element Tc3 transposase [Trichonephila clavipes]